MARYINRDEIAIPKGFFNDLNVPKFLQWLDTLPVYDVVKVVRCKDCAYWDAVKNHKHAGKGICEPPSKSHGGFCVKRGATFENDFCSYGVKKESEYNDK